MLILTDVHHSAKLVMLTVDFNCLNSNATSAETAQLDNNLLATNVKSQDQLAVATNNTTHKLTNVTPVHKVNSPTILHLPKTTDARSSTNYVTETTKFN
jgi:hypothetical protein